MHILLFGISSPKLLLIKRETTSSLLFLATPFIVLSQMWSCGYLIKKKKEIEQIWCPSWGSQVAFIVKDTFNKLVIPAGCVVKQKIKMSSVCQYSQVSNLSDLKIPRIIFLKHNSCCSSSPGRIFSLQSVYTERVCKCIIKGKLGANAISCTVIYMPASNFSWLP